MKVRSAGLGILERLGQARLQKIGPAAQSVGYPRPQSGSSGNPVQQVQVLGLIEQSSLTVTAEEVQVFGVHNGHLEHTLNLKSATR